jgi:branched-chain amino acid transport system substrate-binding protein
MSEQRGISRRDFLKYAGAGAAAVGATGALGGLAAGCGSSSEAESSASAGATGRTIKVGFVAPLTGPLAAFGEPDAWCADQWRAAVKGGVKCGDGQTHPIEILVKDSQSDTNRAATVAGDLITNDGVDIIMAASTADTVPPVADQAEALGCPCITNDCPWQSYFFGRGGKMGESFKWTYHSWWGLEDITATFVAMWNTLSTNKKIAEMWPNDGDGNAWANAKTGQPPYFTKAGYTIVDPGRYQDGTQDYTAQIGKFKQEDCEILSGVMIPPDFNNFWKQSYQQGFHPVAATVGKALLFPSALEALGPKIGQNLSAELWWSPVYPFKSSLTGQTCQQLADAYEKDTKKQWTPPLMHYAIFETVVDVLQRTKNVDSKESILTAIKNTDMMTMGGRITWKAGPPLNPVPNVCKTPSAGGQWVKGTKWEYEFKVVNNEVAAKAPYDVKIPLQGEFQPIKYS